MNRFWIAALAAAASACALPATAQTLTASDPELIAELLRSKGYRAELPAAKPDESPHILSGAGGANFTLYFLDCTKGKDCKAVQYYAGFTKPKMDTAKINEWNRDKRFTRAYIDKEGDAVLEMDVNMAPEGLPRALFVDNLEIWTSAIGEFYAKVFAE